MCSPRARPRSLRPPVPAAISPASRPRCAIKRSGCGPFVHSCKSLRKQMQLCFTVPELLKCRYRRQDVITVCTRAPVALADMVQLLLERKATGILRVTAIDHVAQRADTACWTRVEPNGPHRFAIDQGDLLARAQVSDGLRALDSAHVVSDAAASAAVIKAEHEPWPLGRAAVYERIDAQRAVRADEACLPAFQERETRPPHERAIGKHPQILLG